MSVEQTGELFWESGLRPAVQGADFMFFPGVPLDGKAPDGAALVGVIDSGVAQAHPQLAGYLRACADFGGDGSEDTLGHGTAVALQLLFAIGEVNPPLAILSAKVTDSQGHIRQRAVIDAIEWVAEQGAVAVNLSLGFRGGPDQYPDLCAAIARHPKIRFVAAAGNFGPNVEACPAACNLDNLTAVGAADATGEQAEYSGSGDVYAPGDAVFLPEWAYHYEQGQSLARGGRLQDARREYERSLVVQANAESAFQLGLLDLAEEQPEAAVGRLADATRLSPSFAEAHEMLGAACLMTGDLPRAEEALRASLALYPQDDVCLSSRTRAHFNLGLTLANLGRPEAARGQFQQVKALAPDYPRLDEALASVQT